MTVHKAQGSEFTHVAVVLPAPTSAVLTRELLYTAVTRAREGLVVAGSEEADPGGDRPPDRPGIRPDRAAVGLTGRLIPTPIRVVAGEPNGGRFRPRASHPSRPAGGGRRRLSANRAPAFRRSVLARLAAGAVAPPCDQRGRVGWPAGRFLGEGSVRGVASVRLGSDAELAGEPRFRFSSPGRVRIGRMQVMDRDYQQGESGRRPTALDLWAAGLLLATVILHVVGMFPRYFGGPAGEGSVWSQPDQAALLRS